MNRRRLLGREGNVAVNREERRFIDEISGGAVLHSDDLWREHREACRARARDCENDGGGEAMTIAGLRLQTPMAMLASLTIRISASKIPRVLFVVNTSGRIIGCNGMHAFLTQEGLQERLPKGLSKRLHIGPVEA